jgi:hypothetical protein
MTFGSFSTPEIDRESDLLREIERLDECNQSLALAHVEIGALNAEIERLKAGWDRAFKIGIQKQDEIERLQDCNKARDHEIQGLYAEIERLKALSQNNAHSWDAIVGERDALRAELEYVVRHMQGGIMPLDLHEWKERAIAALKNEKAPAPA